MSDSNKKIDPELGMALLDLYRQFSNHRAKFDNDGLDRKSATAIALKPFEKNPLYPQMMTDIVTDEQQREKMIAESPDEDPRMAAEFVDAVIAGQVRQRYGQH